MENIKRNGNWVNVGTVGTVLISNQPCVLVRAIFPGTYVGTVSFFDTNATAGTSASNNIINLGIPNTNIAGDLDVGANCKSGLVYAATGTPIITFIWDNP